MNDNVFKEAYNKLNKAQKKAVDTIEGPVMVVAGPGTGKTQVLTLRIANILDKTDIGAKGILCLTFTRSGVTVMRERLENYIGARANEVVISTFHSFAISLIEKHFDVIGFTKVPTLITDDEAVFLVDEILHDNEWEHIRPRANPTMYFTEIKQLISLLKRERMSPEEFLSFVESDIKNLQEDPESISTRGESKGKLKKDIERKIESLSRTKEVVEFYRLYEKKKYENGFMDYDDVLSFSVRIVEESEEARADIYENYQYVLVDEHQDSSLVQNNFLKAVWGEIELPNIFVVGDDRQLIYGFAGASLSYFEEFSHYFGKAKQIILTENYRSTSPILALADELLGSIITNEKLNSNIKGDTKIGLYEYAYPRDEILGAGLYFKDKIKNGVLEKECALLVPNNYHVRNAVTILTQMGLRVSASQSVSLFSKGESESFLRVLSIVAHPFNAVALSETLLDKVSSVPALEAHTFLRNHKPDRLTLLELIQDGNGDGLFAGVSAVAKWGTVLEGWIQKLSHEKLSLIVSTIGNELLIEKSKNYDELLSNVEIVRSFIHTALSYEAKHAGAKLSNFLLYIERLQSYGNIIKLATLSGNDGIQVMTLHRSKALEYKAVWIAHMNEETLMSEKRSAFTLPEKVKEKMHVKTFESAKRELYVAITRAKEDCTVSYAEGNYNGGDMKLAEIIEALSKEHFVEKSSDDTQAEILSHGPETYTKVVPREATDTMSELITFVKNNFEQTNVTVTLLNNFFECSWKLYFRNFLKLPEVKGSSLALGSTVHSTIEFILKNKKVPSKKELQEKILMELQKEGVQNENDIKSLSKDAEKAVMNWVENYYKDIAKDYQSERSLQFRDPEFPQLKMYGKLDLTETFPNGDIIVTDFKTGKPKTQSEIEKVEEGQLSGYMRQLAMYSYLVAGVEKVKEVAFSRLMFLEAPHGDNKNALYSTHIDMEQIDLLKRDIALYNNALKSGEWVKRPCKYKPWGGNREECPYCALAQKIF